MAFCGRALGLIGDFSGSSDFFETATGGFKNPKTRRIFDPCGIELIAKRGGASRSTQTTFSTSPSNPSRGPRAFRETISGTPLATLGPGAFPPQKRAVKTQAGWYPPAGWERLRPMCAHKRFCNTKLSHDEKYNPY